MYNPTEAERIIFEVVRKHGKVGVTEVMRFSGLDNYQMVLRRLNILTVNGYLNCSHAWSGGAQPKSWRVIPGQRMPQTPALIRRPARRGPVDDAANGLAGLVAQQMKGK